MGVTKVVENGKEKLIIRELVTPFVTVERECKKVLFEDKDVHDSLLIEDVGPLGKCLYMNGLIQSAEKDSHIYHESLVQPAMCTFIGNGNGGGPKRVLIGGGGELVTAYEVLKHSSVTHVDMVDIDGKVVKMAKEQLTSFHFDCFKDQRLNLIVDDVYAFVENHIKENKEKYDVVIMDICDPTEGYGPARLYTKEFYEMCKKIMVPHGIFASQSTALQTTNYMTAARIRKTAASVFDNAYLYKSFVPSFVESWGFTLAGSTLTNGNDIKMAKKGGEDHIDPVIAQRNISCKYYNSETHIGMFCSLGKDLNASIYDDRIEIATENNLVMFLNPEDGNKN